MSVFLDDNSFVPVTAILDEDGNQIFDTIGILNVGAGSSIAYPQHTLENGVVISDHAIQGQDRVTLRAILNPADYVEVYRAIKKAFRANQQFIIQTKVETYTGLYIESLPHEENARDTIMLSLDFVEQRFQSPRVGRLPVSEVADPADSSTVDSGNKTTREASGTVLSNLFGI